MQKVGKLIICITIIIFLGLFYFKNNNNSNIHYQKDSIYYRQRDSIHKVLDTTEVKIKEIYKTYEKKVETIKHLPIDSAYIFWADYIQRFDSDNDTTTTKNN